MPRQDLPLDDHFWKMRATYASVLVGDPNSGSAVRGYADLLKKYGFDDCARCLSAWHSDTYPEQYKSRPEVAKILERTGEVSTNIPQLIDWLRTTLKQAGASDAEARSFMFKNGIGTITMSAERFAGKGDALIKAVPLIQTLRVVMENGEDKEAAERANNETLGKLHTPNMELITGLELVSKDLSSIGWPAKPVNAAYFLGSEHLKNLKALNVADAGALTDHPDYDYTEWRHFLQKWDHMPNIASLGVRFIYRTPNNNRIDWMTEHLNLSGLAHLDLRNELDLTREEYASLASSEKLFGLKMLTLDNSVAPEIADYQHRHTAESQRLQTDKRQAFTNFDRIEKIAFKGGLFTPMEPGLKLFLKAPGFDGLRSIEWGIRERSALPSKDAVEKARDATRAKPNLKQLEIEGYGDVLAKGWKMPEPLPGVKKGWWGIPNILKRKPPEEERGHG